MTVFAVLMPTLQAGLGEKIRAVFPEDHLKVTETQWLVSSSLTVIDVCAKLGIYDAQTPGEIPIGVAIVFGTSSYYGRAPSPVWEWIKAKLEAPAKVEIVQSKPEAPPNGK